MFLIVTRPVDTHSVSAMTLRQLPYTHHLILPSLSPNAIESLVANHLNVHTDNISPKLIDMIHRRAEGNAFVAEELLLNLKANDMIIIDPHPQTGQPYTDLKKGVGDDTNEVPNSLQELILARLDHLTPAQQLILKLAAIIGHIFPYALLQRLYQHHQPVQKIPLEDELTYLQAIDLILVEVVEPQLTYRFKQVVVQEAIYDSLLYKQRHLLHHQVAVWYEQLHQGEMITSPYLPLLVHHYHHAEEREQEAHYAYLSGQQAANRYANEDALAYFNRALKLTSDMDTAAQYQLLWARERIYHRLGQRKTQAIDLDRLTGLMSNANQQIEITLRRGRYYNDIGEYEMTLTISEQAYQLARQHGDSASQAQAMINGGWANMQLGNYETAEQQYQYAYDIARTTDILTQTARALSGLGEIAFRRSDYVTAASYHQQVRHLWQKNDNWLGQAEASRHLGQVASAQSDYEVARRYYRQALDLARQMGDRPYEGRLLLDLGISDWRQGEYQQAETHLQQSLMLAQSTGDRLTIASSLSNLGTAAYYQTQYDKALDFYEQALSIQQEIGDRDGVAKTLNNIGNVNLAQKQYDQALNYYDQSLLVFQGLGNRMGEGFILNNLGFVAHEQRNYAQAARYAERSLQRARELGIQSSECRSLSNLGRAISEQGYYKKALAYYKEALVIAQALGMRRDEGLLLGNSGIIIGRQGKYDLAMDYCQQSLMITQDIGVRDVAWVALIHLAEFSLAKGLFSRSETYYQQAMRFNEKKTEIYHHIECWAGLALIALRQGDLKEAQTYADHLLAAWGDDSASFLETDDLMRVLHFTWLVFQELELGVADEVLAATEGLLKAYLDEHPDPEMQAMYLQQPHHKVLWTAIQAKTHT